MRSSHEWSNMVLGTWATWMTGPINTWHNIAKISRSTLWLHIWVLWTSLQSYTFSPVLPSFHWSLLRHLLGRLFKIWEMRITMVIKETLSCSLLTSALIPRESPLSLRLQIKRWSRLCESLLHCPRGPNYFTVMTPSARADSNLPFGTNLREEQRSIISGPLSGPSYLRGTNSPVSWKHGNPGKMLPRE